MMRFEWMIVAALGLWIGSGGQAIAQTASLSSCQAALDRYQEEQLARAAQGEDTGGKRLASMTFDQAMQLCNILNQQELNRLQIETSRQASESQKQVQREQQEAQQIDAYLSSMFGGWE